MLLFLPCAGVFIGTFTGLLVSKGHMPAMIATRGGADRCRSIINQIGQGGPFTVTDKANMRRFAWWPPETSRIRLRSPTR
jgi:ribose/xylose/arabinose/galactoside ABC-type transport system permease subunit